MIKTKCTISSPVLSLLVKVKVRKAGPRDSETVKKKKEVPIPWTVHIRLRLGQNEGQL